jgi:hypothetical protein
MIMLHLLISCTNRSNYDHCSQIDQTAKLKDKGKKLTTSLLGHMKNLLPRFTVHLQVNAMSLQSLHLGHIISGNPITSSTTGSGTISSGVGAPIHGSDEPRQTLATAELLQPGIQDPCDMWRALEGRAAVEQRVANVCAGRGREGWEGTM